MRIVAVILLTLAGPLVQAAPESSIDVALAASEGELARAAERGDPSAQYEYARALEREGRPQLAFRWFLAAARQGMALAQIQVARRFGDAVLFPANDPQAFRWYSLAADAREPDAEFALGEAYEQGRGTMPSLPTALSWYARAADNPRLFRRGAGYAVPDGVQSARSKLRSLCGQAAPAPDGEVAAACARHAPGQRAAD